MQVGDMNLVNAIVNLEESCESTKPRSFRL